MEHVLRQDIDYAWEYAVRNEQYSRRNKLRILGLEEPGRNFGQFCEGTSPRRYPARGDRDCS